MYFHIYSKSMDQPGKVANPARGQLNREKIYITLSLLYTSKYHIYVHYVCCGFFLLLARTNIMDVMCARRQALKTAGVRLVVRYASLLLRAHRRSVRVLLAPGGGFPMVLPSIATGGIGTVLHFRSPGCAQILLWARERSSSRIWCRRERIFRSSFLM